MQRDVPVLMPDGRQPFISNVVQRCVPVLVPDGR